MLFKSLMHSTCNQFILVFPRLMSNCIEIFDEQSSLIDHHFPRIEKSYNRFCQNEQVIPMQRVKIDLSEYNEDDDVLGAIHTNRLQILDTKVHSYNTFSISRISE